MKHSDGQTNQRPDGLLWLTASVVLQSGAAVLGKQAGVFSLGRGLATILINPWVVAVFAALGFQGVCWILTLRRLPLSLAYPCMASVLPLNLLCSWALFSEPVHVSHLLGIGLMCAGIWLLGSDMSKGGAIA